MGDIDIIFHICSYYCIIDSDIIWFQEILFMDLVIQ